MVLGHRALPPIKKLKCLQIEEHTVAGAERARLAGAAANPPDGNAIATNRGSRDRVLRRRLACPVSEYLRHLSP